MPLQGDIKVNDKVLGTWRAVRKVGHYDVPNYREVPYVVTVQAGVSGWQGEVLHRPRDGMLVLAAKALTAAAEALAEPEHNHVTREIRAEGLCPGCDKYHENQRKKAAEQQ